MPKYTLGILLCLVTFFSTTFALPSFDQVFPRLSQQGLTRYTLEADFRGSDSITRGEAAKFFAMYAEKVQLPIVDQETSPKCTFTDISTYDSTLTPYILKACAFGLMKGSNGRFMPNDTLTEAQAITVVVRSLDGYLDETTTPRYNSYMSNAGEHGLISSETLDSVNAEKASRSKVGTRLYISNKRANERKLFIKPSTIAQDECMWEETVLTEKNVKLLTQSCVYNNDTVKPFKTTINPNKTLPGFTQTTYSVDPETLQPTTIISSFNIIEFVDVQANTSGDTLSQLEAQLDKTYASIEAKYPEMEFPEASPEVAAINKAEQKAFVEKLKAQNINGECNLQEILGSDKTTAKRYQYAPSVEYQAKIEAAQKTVGVIMEPCGPYGVSNGHQFFQIDPTSAGHTVFVRIGQDMPLFDIDSLTFMDTPNLDTDSSSLAK